MTNTILCPECGLENNPTNEWCDSCGVPLPQPEVEGAPKLWLDVDDVLDVVVDCSMFHSFEEVKQFVDHEPVAIQLTILSSDEASSVRRLSQAKCTVASDEIPPALSKWLTEHTWAIEELGPMLGAEHPKHNHSLSTILRLPVSESLHGKHRVRIFLDDDQISLEELVAQAKGRLTLDQTVNVFRALLNSVRHIHDDNLLYLRLSPWTIHVPQAILNDHVQDMSSLWQTDHSTFDTLDSPEFGSEDETIDVDTQSVAKLRTASALDDFSTKDTQEMQFNFDLDGLDEDSDAAQSSDKPVSIQDALRDTDEMDKVLRAAVSGAEAFDEDSEVEDEEPSPLTLEEGYQIGTHIDFDQYGAEAHHNALLDGSFTLLRQGEEHDEIPVVLSFSAPEIFGRSRANIGVQCDVFSLGMILYYLISGHLPPTSIYTRHTPSIPARNFRPDFPVGFQTIIKRATRPNPSDRFNDLESMIEAFEEAHELIQQRELSETQPHPPIINLCVETHIGISKRQRNPINQDQVFGQKSDDGRFALIVVADGVSTASYGTGDLASKFIKDAAEIFWDEWLPTYLLDGQVDPYEIIHGILEKANQGIIDHVNEHHFPFEGSPHEVMGSTALVSVVLNGVVTLGALGDSRVYLQRGRAFEQLTRDHNLWTLSVLEGMLADNALALPHGDALAKCMGTFYVDQKRLTAIAPIPDIFRFPVISGDTLLMTTDGLIDFAGPNGLMAEDNILSIMLSEPNADLACLELILLANRGGGGDNIGLSIAKFL